MRESSFTSIARRSWTRARALLADGRGNSEITVYLLLTAAGAAMVGLTVPSLFASSNAAAQTFRSQVNVLQRGADPSGGGGTSGGSGSSGTGWSFSVGSGGINVSASTSGVTGSLSASGSGLGSAGGGLVSGGGGGTALGGSASAMSGAAQSLVDARVK